MMTIKIRRVSARFPEQGTFFTLGHDPAIVALVKKIIPASKRHYDDRSKVWEADLGPDLDRFLAAAAALGHSVEWSAPWLGGGS